MRLTNELVIEKARSLGFDLVGFAEADALERETQNLRKWLDAGFNAGMSYMAENFDKRRDVRRILPSAKSVISLGLNYYSPGRFENSENTGKVSRYAWGRDYHFVIWEKLAEFEEALKRIDSGIETKSYVDTGPVMDKAWAVRSGIGWMGKHSNVISKKFGSWIFLATVFVNRKFESSHPVGDHCGTCTRCIDACPTDAIVSNGVVDSNKCISYLTIENKNDIPSEFIGKFEHWIFGCDICQDVCPWNIKFSVESGVADFRKNQIREINLDEFEETSNSQFRERYGNSPIARARLKGMKRNAGYLKK